MTRFTYGQRDENGPSRVVDHFMPPLGSFEEIYKDIHRHPELGKQEHRTASLVASHLRTLSLDSVHTSIGGHGVAAVLKNGTGPRVLLRADMDALPLAEKTGLPYASHVHQRDPDGNMSPVFHGCGHDMHTTTLLATATLLSRARRNWAGTVIFVFQPDEETGGGAAAMVEDGLYKRVPVPDVILGQHVDFHRAGDVFLRSGPAMAAADSYRVTIHGKGGHGALPHTTVDPILIASYIIVRLQSIVSRRVDPLDTAVVSCNSIHGGDAENVIPNEVTLKLDMRAFNEQTRTTIHKLAFNIIHAECASAGAPREPTIEKISSAPLLDNDPSQTDVVHDAFVRRFGPQVAQKMDKVSGSEDFPNLAKPMNIPYVFWFWGCTDREKWDKAKQDGKIDELPRNHMSNFAPAIKPTLVRGVQAFSLAALTMLKLA